jgi:N-acetylneuraminic acid mutarotase
VTKRAALLNALLTAVLLAACSSDPSETPDAGESDSATTPDEGTADSSNPSDMGTPADDVATPTPDQGSEADAGPLTAGWHDRAALPAPQQEVAVVTLDGLVWVMGGFSVAAQQLATVIAYDPATDSWSSRGDFPTPANHMNATVVDGKGRTFVYDPDTDVWTPGPDLPAGRGRGASSVGVIDGNIYVAGGVGSGGAVAHFDVLDPATETWTALPDVPRNVDHAAFGVIDGVFVLASGRAGSIPSYVADVHLFDPTAGVWTNGAPIPTPRGGVASAVHGGKLYVFGGEGHPVNASGVFAEVEAYDLATDSW